MGIDKTRFLCFFVKLRDSKVKLLTIFILSFFTAFLIYLNQEMWIQKNCTSGRNSVSCIYQFERLYLFPVFSFILFYFVVFIDKIFLFLSGINFYIEDLNERKSLAFLLFFSVLISLFLFYFRFSFYIIDPAQISWIKGTGGDIAQNFLGWDVFRNLPWEFPFGVIKNINYPIGTSVGYTDSIPFLAFFFKLFRNFLPENFQYFGMWLFSCYVLQAVLASLIFKSIKCSLKLKTLSTIFLIFSPVLLNRFGHIALNCHWMILASFCIYFSQKMTLKNKIIFQSLLALFSVWIHPYITFLMLAMLSALFIRIYILDKKYLKCLLISFAFTLFFTLISWYLIGYFYIKGGYDGGYGIYSTNLNALFNSFGNSQFLLPLNAGGGQYEGIAYLGAGLILIFVVVLLENWQSKKIVFTKENKPLLFVLGALTLVALSNNIRFGYISLGTIPIPLFVEQFLGVFRSAGRFIWPTYYFIVIFTLVFWITRERSAVKKYSFILVALIIQLVDIYPFYSHLSFDLQRNYVINRDVSQWLNFMGKDRNKIIFYPNDKIPFEDFWHMASKYHLFVNIGYFARNDEQKIKENDLIVLNNIKIGDIPSDTIYVVKKDNFEIFTVGLKKSLITCSELDEYYACKKKD